jgi:hypothetical protein
MPMPGQIGIAFKATTRVEVRTQATTEVIVPIQGAGVVEFFGIPLENAQDVVFVLDCSGSMAEPARGQLAQINTAPPPPISPPDSSADPMAPPPPVGPPPGSSGDPRDAQPPDPTSPPPDAAAPIDPNAGQGASPARFTAGTGGVSTGPRKIDVAQVELIAALEQLPEGTRMNVLFFTSELDAFAPTMVPLADQARGGLIEFVRETVPNGSTALAPAMRTAFMMNARRIVLLSDGLGNVGGNADAVLRDAREAMRGGVRIDTIGLGYDHDRGLLTALASESGGLYQGL